MMFLFIGLIVGSIPTIIKKTQIKKFKLQDTIFIFIGFVFCMLLTLLPANLTNLEDGFSFLNLAIIAIAGIVIAIALILPGVSFSQMLLLLGVYEISLSAIKEKNFGILIPLALSVGIGILLTTSTLEKFMTRSPKTTYLIITGFVVASLYDAFPKIPKGIDILICIFTFALGFSIMTIFSKLIKRIRFEIT